MASLNKVMLIDLYVNQCKSMTQIAVQLGVTYSAIRTGLISAGVKTRSRKEAIKVSSFKFGEHLRGRKRPSFSESHRAKLSSARAGVGSGLSAKTNGYVEITMGENKGRGQHVVIMETVIGRKIQKNEVVHHKDGNKHNNELSNLQLMTRAEHSRFHILERINGIA